MPDITLLTFIPLIWLAAAAFAAAACKVAARADARQSLLMRTLARQTASPVSLVDEQIDEVTVLTITSRVEAGELR